MDRVISPTINEHVVARWLRTNKLDELRDSLSRLHPADIADILQPLPAADEVQALQALPHAQQAAVFGYLEPETQLELATTFSRADLAKLMSAMPHDERADLFRQLPEQVREALTPGLAQAEREDIRRLAAYEEGTAGSVMTSDYAALSPDATAAEAIETLRREAPDRETIYDCYVTDAERRLIGVVSLRDLLLARPSAKVAEIMKREVKAARVGDSRDAVAELIQRYDLIAVPVVDEADHLVGIVTADDAMDIKEAEATEDFRKLGGVLSGHKGGHVGALNIREASIYQLWRMRVAWLVVLVFMNIFSGEAISSFEDTIKAAVTLVFFLPLLIDSGGNAGSQSATLMVRALATGDVKLADWGKMIGREAVVAALLGGTMALAVSLIGLYRGGPDIAVVVALSMVAIVLVGSLIGMSLPFVLSKFRLDPASASAPLITSIADISGVIIYFSIATSYLRIGA